MPWPLVLPSLCPFALAHPAREWEAATATALALLASASTVITHLCPSKQSGRSVPHLKSGGWSKVFWQDHVSASPTHLDVDILYFVVESSLSRFQIFFRGKWCICSCKLGMSGRKWYQELPVLPSWNSCPIRSFQSLSSYSSMSNPNTIDHLLFHGTFSLVGTTFHTIFIFFCLFYISYLSSEFLFLFLS